jgi:transposase
MNEATRNDILRRWHAAASIRRIARELHLARNTVSRVLAAVTAQRDGTTPAAPRRPSVLDAHDATIRELLSRYPDLTATRLLEELRRRGFTGGYTIVRQRLRELRPRQARPPVVRFETAPGVQAQMDYAVYDLDFTGEGRRRVALFSYLLGYSRRQYLRFVESQDFTTTLREHVRAFEHLSGVAATCLYDNQKVVVSGYDGDVPLYNPRFLAFATHYGFRPLACKPQRPQTKGKVERPFHYVETNLLNGRTFRTLEHLNEVTAGWLAEVADVRVHRETKQTPRALHQQEQPHLIPLPARPYEVAPVVYRTVNAEGFISYRQNAYSVPWRHIGQVLPVRVTETEVVVYDPHVAEIARHPLWPRTATGQRSLQSAHRPAEDARQRQAQLQERYAELGESAVRFLEGVLGSQRYGKDHAQRVLALLGTYARADVLAALERAVRYGAFSHTAVERILAVQAQPKSLLQTLADEGRQQWPPLLDDPPVTPRPTTQYQPLCDEDRADHEEAPNPPPGGRRRPGPA